MHVHVIIKWFRVKVFTFKDLYIASSLCMKNTHCIIDCLKWKNTRQNTDFFNRRFSLKSIKSSKIGPVTRIFRGLTEVIVMCFRMTFFSNVVPFSDHQIFSDTLSKLFKKYTLEEDGKYHYAFFIIHRRLLYIV